MAKAIGIVKKFAHLIVNTKKGKTAVVSYPAVFPLSIICCEIYTLLSGTAQWRPSMRLDFPDGISDLAGCCSAKNAKASAVSLAGKDKKQSEESRLLVRPSSCSVDLSKWSPSLGWEKVLYLLVERGVNKVYPKLNTAEKGEKE